MWFNKKRYVAAEAAYDFNMKLLKDGEEISLEEWGL